MGNNIFNNTNCHIKIHVTIPNVSSINYVNNFINITSG